MDAQSKMLAYGLLFAGMAGSNHAGGMENLSLVIVECFQVDVSVTG